MLLRSNLLSSSAACTAPQALTPFSPTRDTTSLYPADAFQTIPAAGTRGSARLSRASAGGNQGRGGEAEGRQRQGSSRSQGTLAVAERSASWSQLREQKLQQQKNRMLRNELEQCTFKPDVGTATASSSFDVVVRCTHWKEQRESRLQAAVQRELRQAALETSSARQHVNRCTSNGAYDAGWAGGEPRFMAPTVAARERIAIATLPHAAAWEDSNAVFAQQRNDALPEWAAPRAQPA